MNDKPLISEHSASQEKRKSVTSIHSGRRRFLRAAGAISLMKTATRTRPRDTRLYLYIVSSNDRHQGARSIEPFPGEIVNLASDSKHRKILQQHRQMLAEWCAKFDTK